MKKSLVILCGSVIVFCCLLITDVAFALPTHSTAQKVFGSSSIFFDNTGYLNVPNSNDWNFGGSDFTIDFWIYPTNPSAALRIMSYGYDQPGQHYGDYSVSWGFMANMQIINGAGFEFYGRDSNFVQFDYRSSTPILPINQWSHVAVVRAGQTLYFFENGAMIYNAPIDFSIKDNNTMPLSIGLMTNNGGYNYLQAYLDELRISKE